MLTLVCLTFELTGSRRQDARPGLVKMYRVPPARAWWPAVGAPVERRVRAHFLDAVNAQRFEAWSRDVNQLKFSLLRNSLLHRPC